ncbi:TPA: hypothetical protein PTA51_001037 [Klebsiella pneumoniae]|nr:hypothetical protein [Klebsiella pneumoniae subsp. pneumoniae]HBQ8066267.1 hypothetical protein [Klebsiella pneumoniae]MBA2088756.1 hypothetical protein [Klebsiella pneumoniae subsp. pneumoniae]MBA2094102.1 hypothetical protein [Klebsiella pneumoniae subsp. pneumoniae]HDK5394241.1 hypothetical protein [Klebsiella pneumoniae]
MASLESAGELSIRETKVMALAKAYQQLAAENVALKSYRDTLDEIKSSLVGGGHGHMAKADMQAQSAVLDVIFDAFDDIETPATDRIVAGIKADGRAEGINFAASRLAAAFNHGFVDKPMAEVGDVVRMILTAKEDLAKDPVLAADGLSGEYAEKSLAEWEAALSDGASYD